MSNDLPGMWDESDLSGGWADVTGPVATLIVDERQVGYLTGDHPADIEHTVRIGGDLPKVYVEDTFGYSMRPLRVGDRVTLATIEVERDETSGGEWPLGPVPFATATVKEIDPWSYMDRDDHGYHITVTDVEPIT